MGSNGLQSDDGEVLHGGLPAEETPPEFLAEEPKLDGPDYRTVEWWEETSYFDTNPTKRWAYGGDYWEALVRCRVPNSVPDNEIDDWINANIDFIRWLDPDVKRQEKYEFLLQTASMHEKAGRIKEAVETLDLAEKQTSLWDELEHLKLWRNRLKKQLE